jgi:DNA-binding response OmpR family regulator
MAAHVCSACGHIDHSPDVFERGAWRFEQDVVFCGNKRVILTPQQCRLLRVIAMARTTVTLEQMGIHVAPNAYPKTIQVVACRIRRLLTALDIKTPFVSVWGTGYRWIAD